MAMRKKIRLRVRMNPRTLKHPRRGRRLSHTPRTPLQPAYLQQASNGRPCFGNDNLATEDEEASETVEVAF